MGLPLLKEAFEAVQAASIPLELNSPESAGEMLGVITRIVARSERKVVDWDNQASKMMRDISQQTKDYLSSGESPEEIVLDLEKLKSEVELRQEKTVSLSNTSRAIADRSSKSENDFLFGNSDLFLSYTHRMHVLMDRDIEIGSRLLDFLTITIADIDPDARGGPSFDNADDLIAYLHRQIEA